MRHVHHSTHGSGQHPERRPRPGPLRRLASAWVDLVLPGRCAGCGVRGAVLCAGCHVPLRRGPRPVRPDPAPAGFPGAVFAAAPYEGPVRAVLIAHKEYGAHAAARPLGIALAGCVAALGPGPRAVLVPVPSTRRAIRARGWDATGALARQAAAELRRRGVAAQVVPALRHTRQVADQAGLSARERAVNVTGALGVSRRLAPLFTGISVVIVDDLVTTGASLAEAARAVESAGARVTGAAVVAATPRHPRPGPGHRAMRRPAMAHEAGDQLGRTGGPPHRRGAMDGVLRGHCRQGPQDRGARAVPQAQRREAGKDPEARRQGHQHRP
ncbi:ComF family protein [Yinghuangia seranimata]|uniref:ComF family protein n=1 Tax=Yinghuangia seranimata TaxID=408067 RepID=UPI00248C0BD8|nr:phosphoribosyltransferase family protein [Yinghuangia seranimata]MDI2131439.1 phosphoribosyltransferase family protein [Yinghuangia seranimata]